MTYMYYQYVRQGLHIWYGKSLFDIIEKNI